MNSYFTSKPPKTWLGRFWDRARHGWDWENALLLACIFAGVACALFVGLRWAIALGGGQ